ncbi:hypothetical protein G3I71_19425 [Streptomyces sp. SID12501]|uniref:Calcium-binding protein n=1 Tax=Streptomyces sp. SID12501 TaxID=2706042 RepID=A0A6B3BU93_9ACTN|nr:hypothetical protein [Streptomyces sp. SID12501]
MVRGFFVRRSIGFSVGAGVLGFVVLGVFALPAGAAESDITFSKIVFNGGKPIVVGTTNYVDVSLTFTVKSSVAIKEDSLQVFAYRGTDGVDYGEIGGLWEQESECKKSTSGGVTTRTCERIISVDPRGIQGSLRNLVNSDAKAWKTYGKARTTAGGSDTDKNSATVSLKRHAKLTVDATPEPVVAGKTVTVTGKITRANWSKHRYDGYARSSVKLQFKAAGASSYRTVKTVTSSSTGALKATATASVDGSWRWSYWGNSTTGSQTSAGDYVDVR